MPKAQRSRQSRPSGPYNLRVNIAANTSSTAIPPPNMGDPYMTMPPQHSPAHWAHQQYSQYPPAVMSSGPEYTHSLLPPGMHHSAMPTPVLPPLPNRSHSRQPSQSTPWTVEEDELLRRARQKGLGWSAIQEQYFPGKSGNACRKRYERVMVKNRGADWDDQKLEVLASQYKKMRMHIWQPLAQSVGEKWETVEKICMSQGLKTLNNKASSHQRNHSSSGGSSGRRVSSDFERERSSPNEDFNDSGIALGVGGRRSDSRYNSASLGHILHDTDGSYAGY